MCETCDDDLETVIADVYERHETADRLDVLKELRVRLNEAIAQAREDAQDEDVEVEDELEEDPVGEEDD